MRIRNGLRETLVLAGVMGMLCVGAPHAQAAERNPANQPKAHPPGWAQPRADPDC
jgi:hypothetical protein